MSFWCNNEAAVNQAKLLICLQWRGLKKWKGVLQKVTHHTIASTSCSPCFSKISARISWRLSQWHPDTWQIPIKLTYSPCNMVPLWSLYNALKSILMPTFMSRLIFGTALLKPPQKVSLQSLSNEHLLEIFSFLELKPYIICHSVCKDWHQLLPSTQIHPIHEWLLGLYCHILNTPDFDKAFKWTDQNLQPFDREEYICCLLTQYAAIPEEFCMWILEWPSWLAIQSTWPGLPFTNCQTLSSILWRSGVNWIAYWSFSPWLSAIVYKLDMPAQTFIPGLLIWHYATTIDWLVFEEDECDLFSQVFHTDLHYHSTSSNPYYLHCEHIDKDDEENSDATSKYSKGTEYLMVFEDWVIYQEYLWSQTTKKISCPRPTYLHPDSSILQPVGYQFDSSQIKTLPAPVWDSCQCITP